jgi:hypothetical protein
VLFLASCSGDVPFFGSGGDTEATPDTFSTVSLRYPDGAARKVNYYADKKDSTFLQRRTFSPNGDLLKVYGKSGEVQYYHDLHPRFDSSDGLKEYLQGMWVRSETARRMKKFDNAPVDRPFLVQATYSRTFKGDTLVISRLASIGDPVRDKTIGQDVFEAGFDVSFRPPNLVLLESILYRRRPDTSQVIAGSDISPIQDSDDTVIDTLRIYSQDRFRIQTAVEQPVSPIFERHRSEGNVPGSLPNELLRMQRMNRGLSSR